MLQQLAGLLLLAISPYLLYSLLEQTSCLLAVSLSFLDCLIGELRLHRALSALNFADVIDMHAYNDIF